MVPQPLSPPSVQNSRANLEDMKMQLVKKIGPQRASRYFSNLNELLSHKLSKPEFNKLCLLILGRENLPLHNQLICAILRNACQAKTPPSVYYDRNNGRPGSVMLQKCSQKDYRLSSSLVPTMAPQTLSNGDSLSSPRKYRSEFQNQRIKDRPSPLEPSVRTEVASTHQSLLRYDEAILRGNSGMNSYGLKRQVQHQQGIAAEQQVKRSRNEQDSTRNKSVVELVVMDDSEDWEHRFHFESIRDPLMAPLGIPFCSASIGGAWRSSHLTAKARSGSCSSICDIGELTHTEVLKKRMEKIAKTQSLTGVTLDCANLLNNGLDAYLKQLIRSSLELAGARTGHKSTKPLVSKLKPCGQPINGTGFSKQFQMRSSDGHTEGIQEVKNNCFVTLQDFKVAMELNPKQLGEDWPLLLERICIHSFEE